MTDPNDELNEILADAGIPEMENTEPEQVSDEPKGDEATGPERDETGKFKAKAEKEPDPVVEPEQVADVQPDNPGTVPQKALHESRQKEKAASERAEALERQLQNMQGQLEAVQRQVMQPSQPKGEEAKPVDFWESPDSYIASQLTPIQKQMQQQAERMSQRFAVQEFGKEAVESAYAEFGRALQTNPALRSEYERIKASDHPYGEIVQWHKQQQTRQLVGDDPKAWLEAELEKRLSDPAEQARIMERIKASAGQQGNTVDPVTNMPKSLSRLPGGGNSAEQFDASDEALFNHAMR